MYTNLSWSERWGIAFQRVGLGGTPRKGGWRCGICTPKPLDQNLQFSLPYFYFDTNVKGNIYMLLLGGIASYQNTDPIQD